ncbi:MAG: hypothetical protein REI95_11130 [Oxalicibacterium faecigallinarum]|uniref:Uncharacterized protein n=1 Tax=Oxalicibacterium faecigallinarum TaxID=573741 RepID=A0A8J3AQC5_9BURK|nr:hypothetical protein [Oxalicibacterium faecigallinarum]MDQ7970186.1 hypothetical protein [Oxalicibacterium faecigallinarum]GGI16875.1 hypothetical protein GCM10008066_06150 [Oxalicibacterium faecigallinarum]
MPSHMVWIISLLLLGALVLAIWVIREVIASDKRKAKENAEAIIDSVQNNIRKPDRKRDRKAANH